MSHSIIEQVRSEGYREGVGQMSMVCQDEAYEKGRREGFTQGEQHTRRWGWFCFLSGIGLSTLVWAFWP